MKKTKTLNIRCTEQEYEKISGDASERNMNISKYMIDCALNPMIPAFVPHKEKIVEECCRLSKEINLLKFNHYDISFSELERRYGRICQLLSL
ncbi:hypothetical protein EDD66_10497 [Mobilisporobacter senegalensis]|uniref:Uncharacterized protein n=1 Tax=Mobilisporobacter senegalensis TaxID=1329262 RepID=A0A3N1XPD0_9FIRM|nr:hypothetical protein [Mobilisporobacter senegalensis]ROR28515.1 hypothetical protein EDD66_10497 [Mobilisporobacter senegalensis]